MGRGAAQPFSARFPLGSLRARIALTFAALMILCVGALSLYLVEVGQGSYLGALHQGVEGQAKLVSVAMRPYLLESRSPQEIDALTKGLGRETGVRVTIIDRSGVVLGDSEHDPATMENHGQRPEVRTALEIGNGESRRRSATVGYDTLYVAVPITEGNRVLGIARVALPLSEINQATEGIARAIGLGGLVAIALAVGLALLIARSVVGPVEELTRAAGRMAEGDLDQRVGVYSRDEVGRLSRVFDLMADRLQSTIKTISSERNTLATVLSTMADGILIVDRKGRVVQTNRAAATLLGAPTPTMEGKTFVEVLRDHELSAVLERCLREATPSSGTAEVGPSRRFLRIVATPLRRGQEGALALLQDLTEIRRMETVRRDFVANVSHELRTPLASLKALVETLEEGAIAEPEVARDFLSKMHVEVDGLAQMVTELLELSRIESSRVALSFEPEELEPLVRGAADRLAAQADRASLKLSVQLPADLPRVAANRERIQQVLVNLIHNAIKFTPAGGEIVVGALRRGDQVHIWVADTGVGITPDALPRIFERFYKADRSRSGGGTGLGLAIARHVVEAHGGRIWAESIEGKGSTFTLSLPVAGDE
ncbi:MAG: ATP-binding protein [Chloroflexota bacterium]